MAATRYPRLVSAPLRNYPVIRAEDVGAEADANPCAPTAPFRTAVAAG